MKKFWRMPVRQIPLSVCTKITNYLTLWELRGPERYLKLAGDLI